MVEFHHMMEFHNMVEFHKMMQFHNMMDFHNMKFKKAFECKKNVREHSLSTFFRHFDILIAWPVIPYGGGDGSKAIYTKISFAELDQTDRQ